MPTLVQTRRVQASDAPEHGRHAVVFDRHAVVFDAFLTHAATSAQVLLLALSASSSFRLGSIPGLMIESLILALIWAAFGLGALLAQPGSPFERRTTLLPAAAASLLAGFLMLRGHQGSASGILLGAAGALALCASMVLYGSLAAAAFRRASMLRRVAHAAAASGAGAIGGLAAAFIAMRVLGVNVSLLSLTGLVAGYAAHRALGPVLLLFAVALGAPYASALEARLEDLRATAIDGVPVSYATHVSQLRRTLLYWGSSGKFEQFETERFVMLSYNSFSVMLHPHDAVSGGAAYSTYAKRLRVKRGSRVLVIGAADGTLFAETTRRARLGTTLVEINDAVTRAYQENPERNHGAYLHSRVIARDGRSVLEASPPGSFDLVIYELADSGRSVWGGLREHALLGSREGIAALDRVLAPRGAVVYLSADRLQALKFAGALQDLGWSLHVHRKTNAPRGGPRRHAAETFAIVAHRPGATAPLTPADFADAVPVPAKEFLQPLSEFFSGGFFAYVSWLRAISAGDPPMSAYALLAFSAVFAAASVLLLIPTALSARFLRPDEHYFFCLGAGYIFILNMALSLLRPTLGLSMTTNIAVNTGLITASIFASLLTLRCGDARRWAIPLAAAMGVIVLSTCPALRALRLQGPGMDLPWPGLLLSLTPLGLAAGLFFPLGLTQVRPDRIGRVLAADALGAFGGCALAHTTIVLCGHGAVVWAALLIYGLACWRLRIGLEPGPAIR